MPLLRVSPSLLPTCVARCVPCRARPGALSRLCLAGVNLGAPAAAPGASAAALSRARGGAGWRGLRAALPRGKGEKRDRGNRVGTLGGDSGRRGCLKPEACHGRGEGGVRLELAK